MTGNFLNFTELSDDEAMAIVSKAEDILERNDNATRERISNAKEDMALFKNEIWDEEDLAFFESLNATPFEFADHRTLVNRLVSQQRANKFSLKVVPTDPDTYRRYKKDKTKWLEENLENFPSQKEAEKYYDEIADDKYAKAVNAFLHNIRNINKAEYVESEVFENGLITGLHFFKCIYSNKHDRNGGIEITHRAQRAMVYDESSVMYDLSDIEFIGEIHELYTEQLVQYYPNHEEEIREKFGRFSNKEALNALQLDRKTYDRYKYDRAANNTTKLKIAELWMLESERRFKVIDYETSEEKMVDYEITYEEIVDKLKGIVLQDLYLNDPESAVSLASDATQAETYANQVVSERFEIIQTIEPVYYKLVFTEGALFEYTRSPYPHGSHPYYPFFAQFTDGYSSGLISDIRDIIKAQNKALAFRELMMAHSAKGLLLLNKDMIMSSGYDLDSIADAYTEVGGMLLIKVAPGQRLDNAALPLTTIGQGLNEINAIIADYSNRLQKIAGVNNTMLGITQGETPTSRYKLQLNQGEANNGLIFDNFIRSLKGFYNDKVVPLCVEYMKKRKVEVIRMIGDQHSDWVEVDIDNDYDMFESAIRNGLYSTALIPKEQNEQLNNNRAAQRMQLAMADPNIPIDWAILHSDDPDRLEQYRSLVELRRKQQLEAVKNQIDLQSLQMIMAKVGVDIQVADEILKKARVEALKSTTQQTNGRAKQAAMGMSQIQSSAAASKQETNLDQNTTQ